MISAPASPARWMFEELRDSILPRRARTLCEFAEQEIVLPDDSTKRAGQRYSYDVMPCKRLLHEAFMDRRWRRRFWSGPSQISGKTLDLEIALMYHLFELGHSCAIGGPDVDMIQANLWEPKLKPLIMSSRFAPYLPARGQGSRGGKFRAMHFKHGPHLYFMGAGGSDSQRVSITVRALFLTELDQLGARSGASIESSPARSMEDRVRGWGSDAYVYGECVVHTKGDLIWQETETSADGKPTGSGGRVFVRCPHCGHWHFPSRENFTGWQEAESESAARAGSGYVCGREDCGAVWSEADRKRALAEPRLVHRGQEVDESGRVTGEHPPTETLGFRIGALHSLISVADVAALEWDAARKDTDAAGRNVCNNVHNEPWDPEASGAAASGGVLTANFVREKTNHFEHGVVPAAAERLVLGMDVGKYLSSWMLPGWKLDATGWLVDAGEVASGQGEMSPELAISAALSRFLEEAFTVGWRQEGTDAPRIPDLVLVDSGWWPKVVYALARDFKARGFNVLPSKGYGSTNRRSPFRAPRQSDATHQVGNGWFLSYQEAERIWLANIDADFWKRFVHARLSTPQADEKGNPVPGCLTLWKETSRMEHQTTAKALVSEVWEERFDPKRGLVSGWKIQNRSIHRLDAIALAAAAADMCGVKVLPRAEPKVTGSPGVPARSRDAPAPFRGRGPIRTRY